MTTALQQPVSPVEEPVCDARWATDDTPTRRWAVQRCHDCPVFDTCNGNVAETIRTDGPLCGVVQGGIAWDDNGLPDADVHGESDAAQLAQIFALNERWEDAVAGNELFPAQPDMYLIDAVLEGRRPVCELDNLLDRNGVIERGHMFGYSLNQAATLVGMRLPRARTLAQNFGVQDHYADVLAARKTESRVVTSDSR